MNLFSEQLPPFLLPQGEGYRCHARPDVGGFEAEVPDGKLLYVERFFDEESCRETVRFLTELDSEQPITDWRTIERDALREVRFRNICWRHDQIMMFGRPVFQPRYTAWYGDADKSYTYSGLRMQPEPWNDHLLDIKKSVERMSGATFNSVLLNWYRDGADHMGWHTDDEKELGPNPVIASVNFGATRRFLFRRKANPAEKFEMPLRNGTLLVMSGALQHHWQHALPKELRVQDIRFNLTFRKIL